MGYADCKEKLSFKKKIRTSGWKFLAERICGKCVRWAVTLHNLRTRQMWHTHTHAHTAPLLFIPLLPAYVQSHMQPPDSAQPFPHTCHSYKNWMKGSSAVFPWWKHTSSSSNRFSEITSSHVNVQSWKCSWKTALSLSLSNSSQIAFVL